MICRILIADAEALVRLGIKAVFQSVKDVVVCGEATNGIDAIRKAHELKPRHNHRGPVAAWREWSDLSKADSRTTPQTKGAHFWRTCT